MSQRHALLLPVLFAVLCLAAAGADGAEAKKNKGKKATVKNPAGKVLTQVLVRNSKDKTWRPALAKQAVRYGELLVGGYGAAIANTAGTVQLTLLGDIAGLSPFPIIESAVIFNNPKREAGLDLDFTLDRGRVDIVNLKKKGAAKVRFHVQQNAWDLVLGEGDTHVALELYGRWPRGVPFKLDGGPEHVPQMDLVLLVLKGTVHLKADGQQFHLEAPPGAALIQWDNIHGWDKSPTPQDKLPEWAEDNASITAVGKLKKETLVEFRKAVRQTSLEEALDAFVQSDNPSERQLAVYVMGATDNLERLGKVLNAARYPDVWQHGVLALRHWIGRGPGQDQILYNLLLEKKKMAPAHAATILQLLHSFGDAELAQPETYEVLIEYLGHEILGIRGLAHWHLMRLVPAGRKIAYSPLDPPEKRAKAQDEWRRLVPSGQVPRKPSVEK